MKKKKKKYTETLTHKTQTLYNIALTALNQKTFIVQVFQPSLLLLQNTKERSFQHCFLAVSWCAYLFKREREREIYNVAVVGIVDFKRMDNLSLLV